MKSLYILGIRIDDVSLEKSKAALFRMLHKKQKSIVFTPNPEITLKGYNYRPYRRALNSSHLNIPDGFGLKIGAFIYGKRLKNRVTGIDLSKELLKIASQENKKVLFLGSTDEAGEKAVKNIKAALPGLQAFHLSGGKFTKTGNPRDINLIKKINKISPDIIFVCLGAPKQELFIVKNIKKINCSIILGVGGVVDFLSGNIKRSPKWMRKLAIEWLYRLFKEPKRFKRIYDAVVNFPFHCIKWRLSNIFVYRRNVVAMLVNNDGKIFLAKRKSRKQDNPGRFKNIDVWQLPQGGVKPGEDLETGLKREMRDEIGNDNFTIHKLVKNAYKYTWPKNVKLVNHFKGQKQNLFILKYNGSDDDIHISPFEFLDYTWVSKDEIIEKAHPLRREIISMGLKNLPK